MKSSSVTIQMKATEQYFPVAPLIMLYKVVLTCTLKSVDYIPHVIDEMKTIALTVTRLSLWIKS